MIAWLLCVWRVAQADDPFDIDLHDAVYGLPRDTTSSPAYQTKLSRAKRLMSIMGAEARHRYRLDQEPYMWAVKVKLGYWGEHPGALGTAVRLWSGKHHIDLTFHPGYTGGAARVGGGGIHNTDMGWTPASGVYHELWAKIRKNNRHTFTIHGANDSGNQSSWSIAFEQPLMFDPKKRPAVTWDVQPGEKDYHVFRVNHTEIERDTSSGVHKAILSSVKLLTFAETAAAKKRHLYL